ncbi:hypothetical protein TNCV_4587311 [Trichonephila clavipes]|nr:hypothetical protein TNCV_4587311 [Trichonephila clavipes]
MALVIEAPVDLRIPPNDMVKILEKIKYEEHHWMVCSALLANYFVWPLFLHTTSIVISNHNHWALAVLLMSIEWTSNRWFNTSAEDKTEIKRSSVDQISTSEADSLELSPITPTHCHAQGDVRQGTDAENTDESEYVDVMNDTPQDTEKLKCQLEIKEKEEEPQHEDFREKMQRWANQLRASVSGVALTTRSGRVYRRH